MFSFFKPVKINYIPKLYDYVIVPFDNLDMTVEMFMNYENVTSINLQEKELIYFLSIDGVLIDDIDKKILKLRKLIKGLKRKKFKTQRKSFIIKKNIETIETLLKFLEE